MQWYRWSYESRMITFNENNTQLTEQVPVWKNAYHGMNKFSLSTCNINCIYIYNILQDQIEILRS